MFSQENVYFRESDAYDVLEKLNAANISVSVIADIDGKYSQGYVFDLITGTGGVLIEISDIVEAAEIQPAALSFNTSFPQLQAMSSMVTQITAVSQMAARLSSNDNFVGPPQHIALPTLRHIFGDNLSFPVIMATGYQQIRLERPLIIGSSTDTDGDGIPDYQEVNLTLLNIEGRRVSLPKIIDLMELPDKPYVDANMMRLGQLPNFVHAIHQRVLPIRSNPADADTDGDGIPDNLDKFPLRAGGIGSDLDTIIPNHENQIFTTLVEYHGSRSVLKIPQNLLHVRALPFSNSKILEELSPRTERRFNVHSVIIVDEVYWLKVEYIEGHGNLGYIRVNHPNPYHHVVSGVLVNEIYKFVELRITHPRVDSPAGTDFSGWYVPAFGVRGVSKPIQMLSQRSDNCSATSHAMGYNYFLSLRVVRETNDDNKHSLNPYTSGLPENQIGLWGAGGATWAQRNNVKLNDPRIHNLTPMQAIGNDSLIKNMEGNIFTNTKNLLPMLKGELNKGHPVILGAYSRNGRLNHFVLVVGYTGNGDNISDFIVIDPHSERNINGNISNGVSGSFANSKAASYNMYNYFMHYSDYFWAVNATSRQDYFRVLTFTIE